MKSPIIIVTAILLTGCVTSQKLPEPTQSQQWEGSGKNTTSNKLSKWWTSFNDPILNDLIELALKDNPEQRIAQARVEEARGLRRSARSSLFPRLGARTQFGVEREGASRDTDTLYDAGFDASYELDLFGKNRRTVDAAEAQLEALQAEFQNVEITLISEVSRTYIEYRAAQKQLTIANNNLETQQKTLALIQRQRELGESPQLDVERSENLVNTTKASIPEFERLAENARLRLAVLTGQLPDQVDPALLEIREIPGANIQPLLLAPTEVLSIRPDIRASSALLQANTALAEAAIADLYPSISLSSFFGVAENVLINQTTVWSVVVSGAVDLIDFGRIEGGIDAARARERQAFEQLRLTVLEAVAEVEIVLVDYARISEQRAELKKAYNNAHKAFELSEDLYREGEVSFLDVLDAQRTLNDSDAALVTAEASQAQSIVRLYKSLGVY